MANIKKYFLDLRQSMPKRTQWLLLGVAFIVVLILLTILLSGGDKKTEKAAPVQAAPIKLMLSPTVEKIEWADTIVGEKRSQTFVVSASAPVKILKVSATTMPDGFVPPLSNCLLVGQIDADISCTITLEYEPSMAAAAETFAFYIEWRGADLPDEMKQKYPINITIGAQEPVMEVAPVIIQQTIAEPEPAPVTASVAQEIKREIAEIAPAVEIEPVKATPTPAAACSDFAFPGYDNQGNQIGWIKPERGSYYFHPFSDKDCDSPTGVYNADTGFITDINNSGKKIGTDAEHIGYAALSGGGNIQVPQLSNAPSARTSGRAYELSDEELDLAPQGLGFGRVVTKTQEPAAKYLGSATGGESVISSMPYDRSFILRQYKPIPATIVSEILADPAALKEGLPVRATVDRNVYSDNGRTVILPTGTLLLGYVTGDIPGPYKAVGRMDIKWYQFIRPDGVEFNFKDGQDPFSGDSQGRSGVPGRGSTDYMEQFIMPMLTAVVPAAVNLIAPISDKFVNQIDLDNNTVVQSGTVRSSELAKNEIITAWNQVAQKLLVDMMDNSVPPFSIAAGTRITVYSPVDLIVTCGDPTDARNAGKKCAIAAYNQQTRRPWKEVQGSFNTPNYSDESWVGQARSFNWSQYCDNGKVRQGAEEEIYAAGLSYSNVLFYCQSSQYQAINNAKQDVLYQDQQSQFQTSYGNADYRTEEQIKAYNQDILGLQYDDAGAIVNPFQEAKAEEAQAANVITCEDGSLPDGNGCCTGEIYTDMGEQGFNCCPETGGDCFPPIL